MDRKLKFKKINMASSSGYPSTIKLPEIKQNQSCMSSSANLPKTKKSNLTKKNSLDKKKFLCTYHKKYKKLIN